MPTRPRILFLCTGNSCRSQMAEGWTRHLHNNTIEALSAGTDPHGLNPLAIRAMAESGIDISTHRSKHLSEFDPMILDLVITVCDSAHEACPVLPGVRILHVPFEDPPRLAREAKSEEEAMRHYRRIRDEIRDFVSTLPARIS
jgi:arsenate reductase